MRITLLAVALAFGLTGCHSAFINATVSNRSGAPITLVGIDYPSASFGTDTLASGQDFRYRFKVLGNGPTSVTWTDAANHQKKSSGPALHEGDDGGLVVTFPPSGAPKWDLHLRNRAGGS